MLHVFIINSFAGKGGFSEDIRRELEAKKDFEYLIFNSEYPGHESVLAGQIYELFSEETIRFYSCGGSGTFRNIMKGLPDFDRAELAEFPCGMTNDFQAVFGKQRQYFNKLDNLINGKIINIDYIKTNFGPVHNTLSSGFDVRLLKIAARIKATPITFGGALYMVAGIGTLFVKSNFKAQIMIDNGETFNNTIEQVTVANGKILGGTFHVGDYNDPVDGKLNFIMFTKKKKFIKLKAFMALILNNNARNKSCTQREIKKIRITPNNGDEFYGNFDGEIEHGEYLEAQIVPKGLKYVVPKEVKL